MPSNLSFLELESLGKTTKLPYNFARKHTMSLADQENHEHSLVRSNEDKAKAIEALLIGSEANLFRELESKITQFCPFEAIGMVRQEIRHAHFLSFILDPNRPHPFDDTLLKTFLQEVTTQAQKDQITLQPLTIHCSDYSNAIVYRERDNIDFMIEIPPGYNTEYSKGLIVAVELKIDAKESKHQLQKYNKYIAQKYPDSDWEHIFVFLTKEGIDASDENSKDWIPIKLVEIIESFNQEISARNFYGEAVDLYRKYATMVRRNLMKDEELAQLAKSIWSKHKEALSTLNNFRPDLQSEIIDWLKSNDSNLTESINKKTGLTVLPDTSSPRTLRYAVKDWCDIPGFCHGNEKWVASKSLLILELADWGRGRLRLSFVLGPSETSGVREQIYEEVLRRVDTGEIKIGRRTTKLGRFKHFSSIDVQTERAYAKAENDDLGAEALGKKVIDKFNAFLDVHFKIYDDVVRTVLTDHMSAND